MLFFSILKLQILPKFDYNASITEIRLFKKEAFDCLGISPKMEHTSPTDTILNVCTEKYTCSFGHVNELTRIQQCDNI